jgi:hypothetical protein
VLVALACAAMLLAGCGGGGVYVRKIRSRTDSQQSLAPAEQANVFALALKYAHCIQAHGAQNFPDPMTGADGKVSINLGEAAKRIDPNSLQFHGADRACQSLRARLPQSLRAQLP